MEQALSLHGIDVETVTTDDDGAGRHLQKTLGKRILDEGTHRWYFAKSTEFYKCSWPMVRWLRLHVRDYDVVHIHALFSFTSIVSAFYARRAGVPHILRPLGTLNAYGLTKRRPLLKRLSLRFLEGPALRRAYAVHVTSESERDQVEALGIPLQTALIPLSVRQADAVHEPCVVEGAATNPYLLCIARLSPVKNVESMLDAFVDVSKQMPNLRLVIAGTGDEDYVNELKARAENNGMGARVCWSGYVEGDAKLALLRGAVAFVLPSFSENFGISVAEAMSAKLPCIVSKGVALSHQVSVSKAGCVTGTDASSIAQGILFVLADDAKRQAMSLAAKACADREFSSDAMAARLRILYESAIARRPAWI
jgi:glycosyltransferase involved in cell wall biosynthesis